MKRNYKPFIIVVAVLTVIVMFLEWLNKLQMNPIQLTMGGHKLINIPAHECWDWVPTMESCWAWSMKAAMLIFLIVVAVRAIATAVRDNRAIKEKLVREKIAKELADANNASGKTTK